ncbi:hypothetical protein HK098_001838 [Nowakowskiella sp. JEL0407]|nr:hypothetical protein HK098_001838 [Nowakowskiella sp. JEL0407]
MTQPIGYIYCPPDFDQTRLLSGPDSESIAKIAHETYTDIAYHKEKNAIQISGESQQDVYAAQTKLNLLFFPVVVKSKRQWARPDRPGQWGQRRDSGSDGNGKLRKMRSESFINGSTGWNSGSSAATTGWNSSNGTVGGFNDRPVHGWK